MKKVGLLVLVMLGFAQVSGTEADYSKMSTEELDATFISAVERGSFDEVQKLVGAGANINKEIIITGSWGRGEGCMDFRDIYTPLQYAAIHGYVDIVKELIKAGVGHGLDTIYAPLIGASRAGHVDVVRELIEAVANVNHADRGNTDLLINTALIEAAGGGHVDVIIELIKAGANVNHAAYYMRTTALIEAAGRGHVDAVIELIKAGAHVNLTNENGDTALIEASRAGHADVVRELIKAGADVNYAAHRKYEHYMGNTALIEAADRGHVDVVRELIKAGAHVNLTNKNGDTALMCAIKKHDFDVVQSLLQSPEFHTGIWQLIKDLFSDSGTKPINYADKDGNTALILAIKNIQYRYVVGNSKQYNTCVNSQRIAEELLKFPGVDHHHVNKNGETAINLLENVEENQKKTK